MIRSSMQEADDFLQRATDPLERAQASLLKAESLFKQKKYAEAGPIYAKLGETGLADDLKTKALYKLGWCQAQTADYAGAIKTYTQYIDKNAGSATLPSAIAQRGLAFQQNKDYDRRAQGLRSDHRHLSRSAPERELALQQKALVLGQQKDYKGMTATFRKLLEDYPKTSAAGQANFWIGWAAFEDKDYKGAIRAPRNRAQIGRLRNTESAQPCASSFVTTTFRTAPRFSARSRKTRASTSLSKSRAGLVARASRKATLQPQSNIFFPSSRTQRMLIRRS